MAFMWKLKIGFERILIEDSIHIASIFHIFDISIKFNDLFL